MDAVQLKLGGQGRCGHTFHRKREGGADVRPAATVFSNEGPRRDSVLKPLKHIQDNGGQKDASQKNFMRYGRFQNLTNCWVRLELAEYSGGDSPRTERFD